MWLLRYTPDLAIDGSALLLGGFYHSDEFAVNPWFQLDMATERKVGKVVLETRKDCCNDRERYLEVQRR